jgi:hypothetical protein
MLPGAGVCALIIVVGAALALAGVLFRVHQCGSSVLWLALFSEGLNATSITKLFPFLLRLQKQE